MLKRQNQNYAPLLLLSLFLSACTLPQVIYVEQPSPEAFWLMHQNSVNASQPMPIIQAPRIPHIGCRLVVDCSPESEQPLSAGRLMEHIP